MLSFFHLTKSFQHFFYFFQHLRLSYPFSNRLAISKCFLYESVASPASLIPSSKSLLTLSSCVVSQ